ncbi:MAG: tetratricopeptide repeat protein, partial [candidate division KSB1 bacterium]|nr:tetratricopeptide repeat protein [candidate division KSB1 bacterium]
MQNFHVNSTLRFRAKEYQLMTSNNGQENKIVCSLFRSGEFINSKEIRYEQKSDEGLLELIRQFHEQRKTEIEQLFYISERLKEENNSDLQNMLGLIFAKNNMHSEAIREFTSVIDKNPNNSWAYENMGKALLALKRYDAAVKAFERAIEISPNYADLHNNMGLVYLERGECKTAVDKFDKAIELNPYYAEAYFNKGLAYILNQINRDDYSLSQNFPHEATRALDKARLINPSYQNDHFSNGLKHLNEGAFQKAFDAMKMAKRAGTRSLYRYEKYEY